MANLVECLFVFEAKRMGYHVVVLDPKPNSTAGQVADEQIVAGFDDIEAYLILNWHVKQMS